MSEEGRGSRRASSSSSSSSAEPTSQETAAPVTRGRGNYLRTDPRPKGSQMTKMEDWREVELATNFVEIKPKENYTTYMYRFDFEPQLESASLRKRIVNGEIKRNKFRGVMDFDGMSDARSSQKIDNCQVVVPHPSAEGQNETLTVHIKRVGEIEFGSQEMLRLYNMNMKKFLEYMDFIQTQRGVYVHPEISTSIDGHHMRILRGFLTAANTYEDGKVLMNLEAVHKVVQDKNVLEFMGEIRSNSPADTLQAQIRLALQNKIVVPNYKIRTCYKVQDVDFTIQPTNKFKRRDGSEISYIEYFKTQYGKDIKNVSQPMLLVQRSNQGRREREAMLAAAGNEDEIKMYVPPELCRIAGLTDAQRNDNKLKFQMIQRTQLTPGERVTHLSQYLDKMHTNKRIGEELEKWKYSYGTEPILVKGKLMPEQQVKWDSPKPIAPYASGSFDHAIGKHKIAVHPPKFETMAVIALERERDTYYTRIANLLRNAFTIVGLNCRTEPLVHFVRDDRPNTFSQALKTMPLHIDLALVMMRGQNAQVYNTVKREATCEKGLVTQVFTSKLLTDERKARGAATKIAIQIAAKLGGEPWHVDIPLKQTMICGYDTYHHTTERGKSYGAFVASTNSTFSKWWSKVDKHERLEEMSTNLAANLAEAVENWKKLNGDTAPNRVIIFRDGVGDGQIEHVYNIELKEAKKKIRKLSTEKIRLTVVIVNKRIGARFFVKQGNNFSNPVPGTVIDTVVTRRERYDFYLISPSTRQGTVSPTYYNIIYDESGIPAQRLQTLAYRLCFNYFNWTGTVRVPAPCQYAHKLALQAGEHMHREPHPSLANRLHFL